MRVGNLHFWVKSPGTTVDVCMQQVPTRAKTSIPHTDTWETAETRCEMRGVRPSAVAGSTAVSASKLDDDDGGESESCRGMSVPAVPEVAGPGTVLWNLAKVQFMYTLVCLIC